MIVMGEGRLLVKIDDSPQNLSYLSFPSESKGMFRIGVVVETHPKSPFPKNSQVLFPNDVGYVVTVEREDHRILEDKDVILGVYS